MEEAVGLVADQRLIIEDLTLRLEEAQDILSAVRSGEVDALIVRTDQGERVYALNGAENAYRVLFEALNEGAVTLAADGTILYSNLRFAYMVGLPLGKVAGASFQAFVASEDAGAFAELLAAGARESAKAEISIRTAAGVLLPTMISVRTVHVPGSPTTCTAVVADLTELRQTQEALRQTNAELEARVAARTAELLKANEILEAEIGERVRLEAELRRRADELAEADRRKDEFLSMLGHELRNPLAPILNAVQAIKLRWPKQVLLQKHREVIERQTRHMARLVDDLLDVSRITRGAINLQRQPVDLRDAIERAVEGVRCLMEQAGHTLTVDVPGEPVMLEADPVRLEQILVNLLKNAAKYTSAGGRVCLTAERKGEDAVVRVLDNGIGIAPELLSRVFDLFVQDERALDRSQGGLGIGLTLVKRLVEQHGGEIQAYSEGRGRGSEFVLRIPCQPGPGGPQADARTGTRRGRPTRARLLIVEDNVDAAETLLDLAELWGYEARIVHNGIEAIEAAVQFSPDVVLCDLGLPELDGYEVARRLRQTPGCRDAHLIALTGYGQEEDRRRAQEAGFHVHLTKPVDPDYLRGLLKVGTRRSRRHRQPAESLGRMPQQDRSPQYGT